MNWIKNHPVRFHLIGCGIIMALIFMYFVGISVINDGITPNWREELSGMLTLTLLFGIFLALPIVAITYEVMRLCRTIKYSTERDSLGLGAYDILMILFGSACELLYLDIFMGIRVNDNLQMIILMEQTSKANYTVDLPSVVALLGVSLAGLLTLYLTDENKIPPLWTVLAISMVYLGDVLCIIWTYHIWTYKDGLDCVLLLLPVGCILITVRVVWGKVSQYYPNGDIISRLDDIPVLGACNRALRKSGKWPIAAFILMWPVLAIFIAVLFLFGHAPYTITEMGMK